MAYFQKDEAEFHISVAPTRWAPSRNSSETLLPFFPEVKQLECDLTKADKIEKIAEKARKALHV